MFLQRNTASQVFVVPGTLRAVADGSAVTSGASLTWVKDGTSAASAGTLTHVSDGGYTYAPTQGETDAKICGWVLSKTGAAGLAGCVRTTNSDPNDGTRFGLTALPNANAGSTNGLPLANAAGNVGADLQTIKGQAVTATATYSFDNAGKLSFDSNNYVQADVQAIYAQQADAQSWHNLLTTLKAGTGQLQPGSYAGVFPANFPSLTLTANQTVGTSTFAAGGAVNATEWGGGGLPTIPTTSQIAAAILKTPANLLATDGNGSVNAGLPPTIVVEQDAT